eukprot:1006653-Amphidinium_carterae.2
MDPARTDGGDSHSLTKSASLSKAQKDESGQPEVTTRQERLGWYLYDWANSPMWQVADVLSKWLLERMAEH